MTQNEPIKIVVDFNRLDADDVVWAFRDRANYPEMLAEGAAIELDDGDGNTCLGYVMRLTGAKVYIRPEWSTWLDTLPVDVTMVNDALDDVLQREARAAVFSPAPLTVGVNTDL